MRSKRSYSKVKRAYSTVTFSLVLTTDYFDSSRVPSLFYETTIPLDITASVQVLASRKYSGGLLNSSFQLIKNTRPNDGVHSQRFL